MNRCNSVRENLTAWIDGQLPDREGEHVAAHVANCSDCAGEADGLRQAISWQVQTLPQALLESPVDLHAMGMGLRRQLAAIREREEEVETSSSWSWLLRPFAMATAAAALALAVVVWRVGQPEPYLVSLGVEEPPDPVVNKPEMFRYLEVMEHLDALEHFDSVEAVSLEDERAHVDTIRHG